MRLFRLLAIFMLTLGVVAIWPTSASSAGSVAPFATVHAPIFADLNGDGLRDKATLGQVGTTDICTVTVQDGLAGGGFGPPKVHRYKSVENTFPLCPDVGTAIKLGNHNRPDLVTGFNFGFTDIVALHQSKPSAVFTGVEQLQRRRPG
jgi:hypothetical protein